MLRRLACQAFGRRGGHALPVPDHDPDHARLAPATRRSPALSCTANHHENYTIEFGTPEPGLHCRRQITKRTQDRFIREKCTNEFNFRHERTHQPSAAHRLPALNPHGTQVGDGVLRDLKGKPVRVSAQFRCCPRNCRRRACSEVPLGDAREGGARRRAASQETCRRLDHPYEPGGVHRRRQRCAIPFPIPILWA